MDKNRKTAIIYYIASAICYISSIIWYMNETNGLGTMWLCIGSANLCLGCIWLKRSKNMNRQDKEEVLLKR